MKRHLFTILSAVSLALCVAAGVCWVRCFLPPASQRVASFGGVWGGVFPAIPLFARPDRSAFVGSAEGRVLFIHQSTSGAGAAAVDVSNCGVFGEPTGVISYSPPRLIEGSSSLGFGYVSHVFQPPGLSGANVGCAVLSVPIWAVLAVTMILPACWLRQRRADRRHRDGRCPACGYDLRASNGNCPECGAAIEESKHLET